MTDSRRRAGLRISWRARPATSTQIFTARLSSGGGLWLMCEVAVDFLLDLCKVDKIIRDKLCIYTRQAGKTAGQIIANPPQRVQSRRYFLCGSWRRRVAG